jgi:hypothetical protein
VNDPFAPTLFFEGQALDFSGALDTGE